MRTQNSLDLEKRKGEGSNSRGGAAEVADLRHSSSCQKRRSETRTDGGDLR